MEEKVKIITSRIIGQEGVDVLWCLDRSKITFIHGGKGHKRFFVVGLMYLEGPDGKVCDVTLGPVAKFLTQTAAEKYIIALNKGEIKLPEEKAEELKKSIDYAAYRVNNKFSLDKAIPIGKESN